MGRALRAHQFLIGAHDEAVPRPVLPLSIMGPCSVCLGHPIVLGTLNRTPASIRPAHPGSLASHAGADLEALHLEFSRG